MSPVGPSRQAGAMEVSARCVGRVPAENLCMARGAFAAVWAAAEHGATTGDTDFLAGVALTCRWLAGAAALSSITGRVEMPRSPIRGRELRAEPETIAEECAAAAVEAARVKEPGRAAYVRGVLATLDWTWNGTGRPPLDVGGG